MKLASNGLSSLLAPTFGNTSIRFIIVGGITAAIYFSAIYTLLVFNILGWSAALFAYLICFVIGYVLHKFFTFKSELDHAISLPRYALLQVFCASTSVGSTIGAEIIGLTHPLAVAIVTTTILAIASYFGSSKWVFQNDKSTK